MVRLVEVSRINFEFGELVKAFGDWFFAVVMLNRLFEAELSLVVVFFI